MRKSGILQPVSAIPSNYGIGAFSKEAYEFVDFLEKADKKGVKIEVYRTGEKEPAFVTGQGGDFAAFAETVAVGDKSGNMERCCKLVRKAINAGKEDAVMRLKRLERELSGR